MKPLQKSFLLAFISLSISWYGWEAGYALAHGSLPFLILFVLPGYIYTIALVEEGQPEWLFKTVFYISQYILYVIIVFIGIRIKRKYSQSNEITYNTFQPKFDRSPFFLPKKRLAVKRC